MGQIARSMLPEDEPVVVEVGSNIGASILHVAAERPTVELVCFEPSDRFRPILARNLAAAGLPSAPVIADALGPVPSIATLYNNESTASMVHDAYADHSGRGSQSVNVTTLDIVLARKARVDLIKVDTDGYDFEILRGGTELLGRTRPILFFELAPGLLDDAVADLTWLQSLGYRRLACIAPGQRQDVLGVTEAPREAVAWATSSSYCDVLCCATGTASEPVLDRFLIAQG
jgi:FkbM family methyltransferase